METFDKHAIYLFVLLSSHFERWWNAVFNCFGGACVCVCFAIQTSSHSIYSFWPILHCTCPFAWMAFQQPTICCWMDCIGFQVNYYYNSGCERISNVSCRVVPEEFHLRCEVCICCVCESMFRWYLHWNPLTWKQIDGCASARVRYLNPHPQYLMNIPSTHRNK